MYLKSSLILILLIIISCQPIEILKPIEIDTSRFEKISINAEKIEVNKKEKINIKSRGEKKGRVIHPIKDIIINNRIL